MRSARLATGMLAFLGLAPLTMALGCWPLDFTESGSGGQSGSGGEGGYQPPSCPGDPVEDPSLVRDDCGTFVSASAAAGGDGTQAKPFQSLGEAANVGATRIYACAEAYDEAANVRFDGGVEIFAGFTDCGPNGAWAWSESSKATLTGAADQPALTLSGGDNALRNLNVKAPSAVAPGGSSIAVVASGGTLSARNGDFTAGDAMDGAAGVSLPDDMTLNGDAGDPGISVCMGGVNNPGASGKTKTCPPMSGQSIAGNGGDGGELMGTTLLAAGSGGDGTPADPGQPTKGVGGIGEGQGTPAATDCSVGQPGASGALGSSGAGASGLGKLDVSGWQGTPGIDGMNGTPGQGGGGGGASKGGLNISCGASANRVGASGGAGGTGGCGGAAGTGGQAGGSAIALVVVDAAVTLDAVMLVAGAAGNGGSGGDGQNPGQPGQGGSSGLGQGTAKPSCNGGNGGAGGSGGPGGGGQGGHSLGIAFQGTAAPIGVQFMGNSPAGTGGAGGLNNTTPNNGLGADGASGACWDFAKNAACPQG
jgi:hypothetical protein